MYDQEIDLRALVDVLRRQLHFIVVCCGICVSAALIYIVMSAPQFSATSLVLVDVAQRDVLDIEQARSLSPASESARVDSEVEIIRSAPTFLRMIDDEGLLTDAYFAPRPSVGQQFAEFFGGGEPVLATGDEALYALLGRLRQAILVHRRGQTYVVAIEATASDPAVAARLANAMAKAHIETERAGKADLMLAALALLEPQLDAAASALLAVETELDGAFEASFEQLAAQSDDPVILGNKHNLVSVIAAGDGLRGAVVQARSRLVDRDYKHLVDLLRSEPLRELERERSRLLDHIAMVPLRGALSPALDQQLADVQNRLDATARAEIGVLENQVATNELQAAGLRQKNQELVVNSPVSPQTWTNIYALQQNAALARQNYDRLLARINQLRSQIDLQQANSRIVAPAIAPLEPSSQSPVTIVFLAGLIGVVIGVGVALLVDVYMGGFTSQEQMEAVTRKEVATCIPLIKPVRHADGHLAQSYADAVVVAPLSGYAESLRRLRLRLDLSLPMAPAHMGAQGRVVVISSAVSLEGKTTTALALARTYGLAGQRVLIIDADLRHPALFRHLDAAPVAGLLDYLAGDLPPEALATAVGSDPLSGISTIVNARPGEGATERFLTNAAFRRLIGAARKAYDIIIVDTPPIMGVVDAAYAMKLADAIVFVARFGNTRQRHVTQALAVIQRSRPDMPPVLMAMSQQPETVVAYAEHYDARYVLVQ